MHVFVTGGTGMLGTPLVHKLLARGYRVDLLTRRYARARQEFGTAVTPHEGDPMQAGSWMEAAAAADGVINLYGENIFNRRWHPAFKQLLRDSRVQSTTNVAAALASKPRRLDGSPKVLVNASAIGFYGPHDDEVLTEDSPPGSDFLADLSVAWEHATEPAQQAGVRVPLVRVGVVLARDGGALAKLLTPFKLFVGGPVASGRQYMSWIHHDDLTEIFLFALESDDAFGPINATAPNPVTNRQFSTALGHALLRPSFVWTPGFALKVVLGEVADVVIKGARVVPERALSLGFPFHYPELGPALEQILQ